VLNGEAPLEEAIHRLRERHVRRAPVVSSSGKLIGVISFDDLLAHVVSNLGALAHLAEVRLRAGSPGSRAGHRGARLAAAE
jgi:CBS domain-containing protein